MFRKYHIIALVFVFELIVSVHLQAQKKEEIKIINSNSFEYAKKVGEGVRRLIGNVVLEHNNATMYCDSAYLYSNENTFHAYSNVHVNRGDTLHMYGDFMRYNGNTNIGEVRRNVILKDSETVLTTDSLNFNTITDVAWYFNRGKIINNDKQLTSIIGYYYSKKDLFFFKDSVIGISPDYTMITDTLEYNTKTETAYFVGPTNIYNEENHIYAENGWYKTKEKKFQFNENAVYQNKEKILKGDSLYYDDANGIGIAIKNIDLIDTTEHIHIKGNYAYYKKEPENFLITDSALLIQITDRTDSLFLHADTLKSNYDSTGTFRILKAYHKVKIFRDDFQGMCDSMAHSFQDSVIRMYRNPVIWSEGSQLTADLIEIHTKNRKMDHFKLIDAGFIVSQEDSTRFNQIRGKQMVGYIRNNRLYKVDVFGNGQTIYFTKDKDVIIGVNQAESSDLIIYLRNNQVERINMIKQPAGTLYPLDELQETKLKGFQWLEYFRPKEMKDIFTWETKN
ncbi:MAG: hypothetical protein A2X13_05005 [Bacteroidetes bacterium GWC2_33_15]|nr:MAG: hypothetical protein A2X10_12875 [Bacteroidetes bacterium GWA2_33_15]OFX50951.1 MAG: hypothetical protein A2X13_05005 [Bacteroidetes bacterium GWC2_33_15]OFX66543.1 MAG: hypothetical protein A2X15_15355 [Bacteroidetes bacterium GWB2_32_14]OFX70177.1 MAG: hypothetical protein A2X14_12765 [Bacteroidetes bacterium GWD2_33_33]HAN20010.1 organic solvent tolerance protein OstA [Bacteroidales bacterium]